MKRKKKVERTRASNTLTEAGYRAWVISLLRKGTLRWKPRNDVLQEAKTERKRNIKTNRLAQHYRCSVCFGDFPLSEVVVDHIKPVIDPLKGFTTFDEYIEGMFCETENLQCLCKACHKDKTADESSQRKRHRS